MEESTTQGVCGKNLVHRARPVALKVKGDIGEPEGLQTGDKVVSNAVIEQPGNLLWTDLDAGGSLVVEADTEIPEAAVPQERFCLVDPGEVLPRDAHPVGETRGEAGEGRLVPR